MNTKYIIGLVVVVVLALGAYFIFHKTSRSGSDAANVQDQTSGQPVTVSMIKSAVDIYNASTTKTEVIQPVQAYVGDSIETSASGRGLLEAANGSVTVMDYSTKVTIKNHADDQHSTVALAGGNVWSTVEKVFGQGEFYEIQTQNAVAVVRGTSFGVSYHNGLTTLEVATGTVAFIPVDPKTGERLLDKLILVTAGKKAVIADSGVIAFTDMNTSDKQNDWYVYNNEPEVHVSNVIIQAR